MSVSRLADVIMKSRKTVFFGGAGTSTASGIPDFRSANGLYQTEFEGYNPEVLLSRSFFFDQTPLFYSFLRKHMHYPLAEPNLCHKALASLEGKGLLHTVITQNIDGLHQRAGSRRVIELHGNMNFYSCIDCGKPASQDVLENSLAVPTCSCGGILKPEVTLYEEMLDESVVEGAIEAIQTAEVLIIGGTSLSVYPAAGFIRYFTGNTLCVINQSPTSADAGAQIVIREPIDLVFGEVLSLIEGK